MIQMARNHKEREFHDDMKKLMMATDVEQSKPVFFFRDIQIITKSFIADINSLLSSDQIRNMFEDDEIQQIREAMRSEAKKRGLIETPLFVQCSSENLHVVLAISPAGDGLRNRVRMYQPLVNNTTISWFNEWPKEVLLGVTENLMFDAEFIAFSELETQKDVTAKITKSFVEFHKLVDKDCLKMLGQLHKL